jgi:N-acetylglucosaminyldiphosphoundecaprenol N-acetyl-beta-D-mannosaminyltransferase
MRRATAYSYGTLTISSRTTRETDDDRVVTVRGIPITDLGFEETVDRIMTWAQDGSGGVVCTPNVSYVVRADRDPDFRAALLSARLRVPDGMGIVYGSRILGVPLRATVTGRLLPLAVAQRAAAADIGLAFFGGGPGVAESAAVHVRRRSGAVIDPAFGPTMGFAFGTPEDAEAVTRIARSTARIVFVALGAPKQERWMVAHQDSLAGKVLIGVGQAFDVLSGRLRAAPAWATRMGTEWAFRLAREPRRLSRRYLVDDPRFFLWMLRGRLARPSDRGHVDE